MPKPRDGEKQKDFVSRCIPVVLKEGTAKDEKQAAAICYNMWEDKKMKNNRVVSLSDRQEIVGYTFYTALEENGWDFWVIGVYDDYLVAKHTSGQYMKVPYDWNDGSPIFSEPTIVEEDWVEKRSVNRADARHQPAPIRAVQTDDGDTLYECCMIRFTGPSERDAYGTYFDEDTDFCLDWFDKRVWLYDHTLHPDVGKSKVGTWTNTEVRSDGVFVQGELDRHFKYKDEIETLIDLGVLFPSSGTLSYAMNVADDGHVNVWPFIEGSSTVTPADIGAEAVTQAVKAYRMLEGDETMSDKNEGLLGKLFSRRAEDDVEEEAQDAPEVEAEVEPEAEPTDAAPQVSTEDVDEIKSAVRALDDAAQEYRNAIVAIDEAIRSMSERMSTVESAVEALGKEKAKQVQDAMKTGSFMSQLFVAHRQAGEENVTEQPVDSMIEQDTGDDASSPAVAIVNRQRRTK